jgi:hypothetical protein
VWGDRYAGVLPRERFGVHGINYEIPHKSVSDFYCELLPVLNSRRAELLDHARFVTQLCQLERHAGSAKDNIKHPPGGHDDIVNAVAGAVVTALTTSAQEVTSFPIPFVAGVPRNIPGGTTASAPIIYAQPGTSRGRLTLTQMATESPTKKALQRTSVTKSAIRRHKGRWLTDRCLLKASPITPSHLSGQGCRTLL